MLLLLTALLSGLLSCAQITEEEETETVTETVEVEPEPTDMISEINAQLELLASAYDAIIAANPEGVDEYDFIDANPDAFDAIVAWGEDAVPYLCEIGAGHRTAFFNMRIAPEEYTKCILAYAAAQEIDSATFNRAYESPDGVHVLYQSPTVLWGMADAFQGILYDIFLSDARGAVLAEATGFSSLAYIDWTEDGRYAVVSDRLMEETLPAQTTVFDAEQKQIHALPGREVFDEIAAQYGQPYYTIDTRYLDSASEDVLRIWLGLKMTDGQIITGYYDYDMIAGEITALEYAPFDSDGTAFAEQLQLSSDGSRRNYWHTGDVILRFDTVRKNGLTTLSLGGQVLRREMAQCLRILAAEGIVIAETTALEDGASEIGLFDYVGGELFSDSGEPLAALSPDKTLLAICRNTEDGVPNPSVCITDIRQMKLHGMTGLNRRYQLTSMHWANDSRYVFVEYRDSETQNTELFAEIAVDGLAGTIVFPTGTKLAQAAGLLFTPSHWEITFAEWLDAEHVRANFSLDHEHIDQLSGDFVYCINEQQITEMHTDAQTEPIVLQDLVSPDGRIRADVTYKNDPDGTTTEMMIELTGIGDLAAFYRGYGIAGDSHVVSMQWTEDSRYLIVELENPTTGDVNFSVCCAAQDQPVFASESPRAEAVTKALGIPFSPVRLQWSDIEAVDTEHIRASFIMEDAQGTAINGTAVIRIFSGNGFLVEITSDAQNAVPMVLSSDGRYRVSLLYLKPNSFDGIDKQLYFEKRTPNGYYDFDCAFGYDTSQQLLSFTFTEDSRYFIMERQDEFGCVDVKYLCFDESDVFPALQGLYNGTFGYSGWVIQSMLGCPFEPEQWEMSYDEWLGDSMIRVSYRLMDDDTGASSSGSFRYHLDTYVIDEHEFTVEDPNTAYTE